MAKPTHGLFKPIVDQALTKRSYSELDEVSMSLYRLSCKLVDIKLRYKQEQENKGESQLPGQSSLVDLNLEVGQREDSDSGFKN